MIDIVGSDLDGQGRSAGAKYVGRDPSGPSQSTTFLAIQGARAGAELNRRCGWRSTHFEILSPRLLPCLVRGIGTKLGGFAPWLPVWGSSGRGIIPWMNG